MSGVRRNRSSCDSSQQYAPYMFGNKQYRQPAGYSSPPVMSVNTICAPPCPPPNRTYSMNDATVRDCMYWPASLNGQRIQTQRSANNMQNPAPQNVSGGDFMYCLAPPKVFISTPGQKGKPQGQSIPCAVAPLGTDPMSMIKPLAPLTVRVQAPSDLFSGNSSEPRTISISPNQLYGSR